MCCQHRHPVFGLIWVTDEAWYKSGSSIMAWRNAGSGRRVGLFRSHHFRRMPRLYSAEERSTTSFQHASLSPTDVQCHPSFAQDNLIHTYLIHRFESPITEVAFVLVSLRPVYFAGCVDLTRSVDCFLSRHFST